MFSRLPKRTQEVLWRRFGLKNNKPETLEAIGRDFGITRERVRQIEENGLASITKSFPESYKDFVRLPEVHLESFGGVREERKFLEELVFALKDRHPASHARARFLLLLSDKLTYWPETLSYNAFWSLGKESGRRALKFLEGLVKEVKKQRNPFSGGEVETLVAKVAKETAYKTAPRGTLVSYVHISKELAVNPFGQFGFTGWASIIPKGVRDRAYLILKYSKQPVHFQELAKRINEQARTTAQFHPAWQKPVEVQTVHNELIKDENFVLVGRGMYALKEWGYEAGTVRDLIHKILATSRKPLEKEELMEAIKKQRFVQESTILINLQNRKFFERMPDGRYRVRGHRHVAEEA